MCGLIGAISKKTSQTGQMYAAAIDLALEKMAYRGPDNKGVWFDNQTCFGHRRLSIIDLSENGNQPFHYNGSDCIVVFNGEIYNYQELKSKLISFGYTFKTETDTEVLVVAYRHFGDEFCKEFRGMFALVIYDRTQKKILFARDRLGKKPLFIYEDEDLIAFSSEIKFLHAFDIPLDINPIALKNFISLQYIPGPETIYRKVKQVNPAEVRIYDLNTRKTSSKNYWSAFDYVGKSQKIPDLEEIDSLIKTSIKYRLIANVDVGLLLSGGIDSSLLASYMEELASKKVRAFNVSFTDQHLDESIYAGKVANALGMELTTLNFQDVNQEDFTQAIFHGDQPLGDAAIVPTYLISKSIGQHVKVVLSGEGADELFHGYQHYNYEKHYHRIGDFPFRAAEALLDLLPESGNRNLEKFKNTLTKLNSFTLSPGTSRWSAILSPSMANQYVKLDESEKKESFEIQFNDLLNNFRQHAGKLESSLMLDLITWLPDDLLVKTDRMMMASSVEARTPFLDHKLVERVLESSGHFNDTLFQSKNYLRRLLKVKLPSSISEIIANRPKQGFETPKVKWMSSNLSEISSYLFSDENLNQNPYINEQAVKKEWKKFKNGAPTAKDRLIWNLFCFLEWYRQHCEKFGFKR